MLDMIKKMFCKDSKEARTSEKDALNAHTALAVLLMEAAYADGECSKAETEHMADTLVEKHGVTRNEINGLLEMSNQAHQDYVDLFRYTRFINEQFSENQRITILESVWRIILLDGHLEDHENHFVHKLANLLGFSHKDLIDAKLKARRQLEKEQELKA